MGRETLDEGAYVSLSDHHDHPDGSVVTRFVPWIAVLATIGLLVFAGSELLQVTRKDAVETEQMAGLISRGKPDGVSEKAAGIRPSPYPWTSSQLNWQRTGFHFQPEKNWMNDPDGPVYYKGWYHLFYQYNPDSAVWGNITWGHAVSNDLVHWQYLPIALAPSAWYDSNGVWTGSATVLPGGQLVVLYTGSTNEFVQVQNLAVPEDPSDPLLLKWVKSERNPVLVPPPGIGLKDFRDPTSAWLSGHDGFWRIAIGSKLGRTGVALVFRTKDFVEYEQQDILHQVPGTGMWECVDFYPVSVSGVRGLNTSANGDGVKHVLKASLDDNKHDYYAIGTLDVAAQRFVPDDPEIDVGVGLRLDYGKYYASKTFFDPVQQRRILWGWVAETDSEQDDLLKGWASVQTIPRVVWFDSKTKTNLLQWPVEEINDLRISNISLEDVLLQPGSLVEVNASLVTQLDIELTFDFPEEAMNDVVEADVVYKCSTSGGSAGRGVLGPFGLLVLADKNLTEQTAVYFYIAKSVDGRLKTFFCHDETRSSLGALPPVECKYVTEECIREWKTAGSTYRVQAPVPPVRFIYELFGTLVRGELPFPKCRIALDSVEFSEKQTKEEIGSILADTIAYMGQELTLPGEFRGRLVELAKWLVESGLIHVRLLQERCEAEFLWESEMIKIKATELKAKEVRVNTRLLYQQTKFNLLREESEGYAKLLTLLCQYGSSGLTQRTASAAISTIKSLIGHFDLDPNRVFDIVLECFELQPEDTAFFELIPIFPKSHASHILGFKFQYYQRLEVNDHVPNGLYRLTAALVKADFIDLDNIYAHLLPKDEEALEHYEEFSKKRLDEANKIGRINLAATGKDLMEEEEPRDVTIDLFAALDMEIEAVAECSAELITNQKLGLLNGFLCVDDWSHAHILIDRLAPLNPVAHNQICDGIFRAIEKAISASYALVRPSHLVKLGSTSRSSAVAANAEPIIKYTGQASSFVELPRELFQMLASVGPYLHRDALLLQKVCRVLRGYYSSALALMASSGSSSAQELGDTDRRDPRLRIKEARLSVEEALGTCLLPSLQLVPANPAVGQEIWEVMSLLPYEARYRLYGEWEKDDERIPMVLAARQTAKLDTRRILKRLAKENLKQLGRMVAKIAHANPMTVLRTIVHQIEAYKDMITPVVDAFKYLTQLEYDVLEYVVIERLAQGGREKLKEDGLNLSDWLQSLASFWGHLCKKYPSMELRGLFQYLVNQLKKGEGIELVLLQELIQQMANVQYTENMTEEQLDAMAGGEALRYQATSFGITRNNKALIKSTNRLRDSLLPKDEPKLAVPLLLLIAQHRSIVVINADAPHIKMVSEQFDRSHGTLLQYVEFLTCAVTPITAYAQLIPTLDDLVHKYHLEPEVAFLIYRPIMRLFKHSKGGDASWPADTFKAIVQSDGNKDTEHSNASSNLILDLGSHRKPVMWSDLLATVHSMLPSKAWNSLSPELYATFWGLTLYDLYVPRKRYESEIAKQHAALKAFEEISDNSHTAIAKRKKDKERIQEVLDRLTSELQKQEQNVAAVHQRLVREKDSWLTSCPDSLKINMEFLQRCIFPRCVFSMPDAVYCAKFVHCLHSLGTPFFNTVNHIDVLICKALQPMICCCTEFEAGRLGRFLYETLKMAYHWKSDESIYDRECGNMPGFAVYYRDPNSQRVTFAQYIKVHWKWSGRITRLLIQCLESTESMEIRNALIILTKISSVFPVTRKSGINLEKRVGKIKADEREDLKVLATGVAAALAARKSAWVSEEEFGMGCVDLKPSASPAKHLVGTSLATPSSASTAASQLESAGIRNAPATAPAADTSSSQPDQIFRPAKPSSIANTDERSESITPVTNSDLLHAALKSSPIAGTTDSQTTLTPAATQAVASKSSTAGMVKPIEEPSKTAGLHQATAVTRLDENASKVVSKSTTIESEARAQIKRANQSASLSRQAKPESVKDDARSAKTPGRPAGPGSSTGERDTAPRVSESRQSLSSTAAVTAASNGSNVPAPAAGKLPSASAKMPLETSTSTLKTEMATGKLGDVKVSGEREVDRNEPQEAPGLQSGHPSKSPHREEILPAVKSVDDTLKGEQQKRLNAAEDTERLNKRRKGDNEDKVGEVMEGRCLDQRPVEKPRSADQEKSGHEERSSDKAVDKSVDRPKDRVGERLDRDHRERPERPDKSRGEEHPGDRARDRSMERYGRERSVDRVQDRLTDRSFERSADRSRDDRNKDDRNRSRYTESTGEKPHPDDRFPMQNLPPPPPLPPNVVPQSLPVGRRDDEVDRRAASTRPIQRLSPRREEKIEKRRLEEGSVAAFDESKRRREDEFRDRKREERDVLSLKTEKERDRDKASLLKEESDVAAASKRRRLKRDHLSSSETPANYGPSPPPLPPSLPVTIPQPYDGRERDRKAAVLQRNVYMDESGYDKGSTGRMHNKEGSKVTRRDHEQLYERDWEDEKRQRGEAKRRHHRK